jgi:hypothetical protein
MFDLMRKSEPPLFEIALVFVRFDHDARCIVNANHRIVRVSDEDLHKN